MLTQRVDLFDSPYGHFSEEVLATLRRETFGLHGVEKRAADDCRCR